MYLKNRIIFFFLFLYFVLSFYFFPSIFFISVYFVLLSLVSFHFVDFVSFSLISFRFYFVSHFIGTLFVSSRPLKSVNTWIRSPFWNALSREFRCRWHHLSWKLRPEIDNGFTFNLIKTTMRFKQIRKDIYRFWCQNGAILLLPFWLNNQSQIFPEKHSP